MKEEGRILFVLKMILIEQLMIFEVSQKKKKEETKILFVLKMILIEYVII
jgi:hypothetical protein